MSVSVVVIKENQPEHCDKNENIDVKLNSEAAL